MLTSAFYQAISGVVDWVNQARPAWTPTIDPSMTKAFTVAASWDWLFPIHETLISVTAILALLTALIAYKWIVKIADWIADVIP